MFHQQQFYVPFSHMMDPFRNCTPFFHLCVLVVGYVDALKTSDCQRKKLFSVTYRIELINEKRRKKSKTRKAVIFWIRTSPLPDLQKCCGFSLTAFRFWISILLPNGKNLWINRKGENTFQKCILFKKNGLKLMHQCAAACSVSEQFNIYWL